MAKGFQENQKRVAELGSFGKDLARRARSKCELCETGGLALKVFEVPPVEKFPRIERCAFLCENCALQMGETRRFVEGEHWRCLAQTVWSEVPALQVLAVRGLRRLAGSQAWARSALEDVYLDPEVEAWVEEGE
jgi:protein PhnA